MRSVFKMAGQPGVFFVFVYGMGCITFCVCSCTFPTGLRGVWMSAQKGFLRFSDSELRGYPVKLHDLSYLDFECAETFQSQYMLRSNQTTLVFGQNVRLFMCLDIQQAGDNFVYYLGTDYQSILKENLFGRPHDNVSLSDVCNKPTPYDVGSAVMLIRNVTDTILDSTICPENLLANYSDISIIRGSVSENCPGSIVDSCSDNSTLTFAVNSSCDSVSSIDLGNVSMSCLYHITKGDVTYLYTYSRSDDVIAVSPHGFICIELHSTSDNVTMTIYPEYCTDLMSISPLTSLSMTSSQGLCFGHRQTSEDDDVILKEKSEKRSIFIYYAVAAVIVVLILVLLFSVLSLCRKKFCFQCRLEPVTPPQTFSELPDDNK